MLLPTAVYKGKSLEGDVKGDTSGWYRNLLVSLCSAQRDSPHEVNMELATDDARRLYKAGEARVRVCVLYGCEC